MKRKHIYLLIWLAFISYASLSSSDKIPKFQLFEHFDKVVHFGMYFGLTTLFIPILKINQNYNKTYLFAFIISSSIGIMFELAQGMMNMARTSSIYDVLANCTGALFGMIFYQLFIRNKKIEKIF